MKRNARALRRIRNGIVLVGSDAHYWPGKPSTAHRAFVELAHALKPSLIVLNGDVIDAASISRHPRIGWEYQPSVKEEIDVGQERLAEIEKAAPKADRIWTLGNHDARFEMRLAERAPEFAEVHGIHLKDHFPRWHPAWSVEVNGNTIIKHRWKGGTHAAFNNAKDSGRNIVTGHLHSLGVSAYTDYSGTRFGADGGTLASPLGPQFTNYTEDNPLNWRSGFLVLTFDAAGSLLWPEVVHVVNEAKGRVNFRGELFNV